MKVGRGGCARHTMVHACAKARACLFVEQLLGGALLPDALVTSYLSEG